MPDSKSWSDIFSAAVAWVIKVPKLLLVIVSARFSGELWIYLYVSYYKNSNKNNHYVNTHMAKTIAGLIWMAAVFIPLYFIFYGMKKFDGDDALDLAVTVVIYSLFIELIVTVATIAWKTPR